MEFDLTFLLKGFFWEFYFYSGSTGYKIIKGGSNENSN